MKKVIPKVRFKQEISIGDKIKFIKQEITQNVPSVAGESNLDELTQIDFINDIDTKILAYDHTITIVGRRIGVPTQLVIDSNNDLHIYINRYGKKIEITSDTIYNLRTDQKTSTSVAMGIATSSDGDCTDFNKLINEFFEILKNRKTILAQAKQESGQGFWHLEDDSELRELKQFFVDLSTKYAPTSGRIQDILTSEKYSCTITRDVNGKIIIEFIDTSIRTDTKHYKIAINDDGQLAFYLLVGEEGSTHQSFEEVDEVLILTRLLTKIKEKIEKSSTNGEVLSESLLEHHGLRNVGEKSKNPDKSDATKVVGENFEDRKLFFASRALNGAVPLPKPFPSKPTTPKPKEHDHKATGSRENISQQEIQAIREISQQAHQGIFDTDNSEIQQNHSSTLSSQGIFKKDEIVPDLSIQSVSQSTLTFIATQENDDTHYQRAREIQEDIAIGHKSKSPVNKLEESSSGLSPIDDPALNSRNQSESFFDPEDQPQGSIHKANLGNATATQHPEERSSGQALNDIDDPALNSRNQSESFFDPEDQPQGSIHKANLGNATATQHPEERSSGQALNDNATATQHSEERSPGQALHNQNQEILSGIFVYDDNVDSPERSPGQALHNQNQEILSGIFVYDDNVDSPERSPGQALSGQSALRGGHDLTPLNPTTRNFHTQTRSSCFTGMLARCFGGGQGRGVN